jgi:hypothetical protein
MMTLGDMITKMNDEHVEDVNTMVTALSGAPDELVEALVVSLDLIRGESKRADQFHVLIGVLGFGVAIGYYRALQQYDELLGLAQQVRDKREGGLGPC